MVLNRKTKVTVSAGCKNFVGDEMHRNLRFRNVLVVVTIQISKDGKELTMQQLEKEYQNWIHHMHSQYDDECILGGDEPVWLTTISNKAALHVTSDGKVYNPFFISPFSGLLSPFHFKQLKSGVLTF